MARKVISGGITGLSIRWMDNLVSEGGAAITPWYAMEPNSYNDFGGKVVTVTRNPISRSRQRKKGVVTDFDASGGFNHDLTQKQLQRVIPSFFYAPAFEKPTTAPLFSAAIPVTAVDAVDGYTFDNSPDLGFLVGHLIYASGFPDAANNGLKLVSAISGTFVSVAGGSVASVVTAGKIEAVGFQFGSGDVSLDSQTAQGVLHAEDDANVNFAGYGLHPGEWVFVGDSSNAAYSFAGVTPFYARVSLANAPTDDNLYLDKTTATLVDTNGAAKTIRVFFGSYVRNMTEAEIQTDGDVHRHFMTIERTLGRDGVGIQSQVLHDAFANALTYSQPLSDKVSVDATFVALDEEFRNGTDGLISGVRVEALGEGAYNTSTCLFRARMSLVDPATLNPTAMFAYVQSIELTIENNVQAVKAQGDIGGIDTVEGDFGVGGSATVYFSTVAAVNAIRDYSDVTFDTILAKANAGYVFDIPLLGLGNGRLAVTKDDPITVPLDMGAAENAAGYTASYTNFTYLPDAAMPAAVS